jgi:CBS domain-containing protein
MDGRTAMPHVSDLLNIKSKEIHSVSPDDTVLDALKLMREKEIGALIVRDGETVVGIFSERDYARKIILLGKNSKETLIREVMSSNLIQISPGTSVEDCMILMTGKHVRHLPVFDKGKFVGIISIGDVVKSIISNQEVLIDQLSDYISGSKY